MNALCWAAGTPGADDVVDLLLNVPGIDVNAPAMGDADDDDRWTPLMAAAGRGLMRTVTLLLLVDDVDVDAGAGSVRGTALHLAVSQAHDDQARSTAHDHVVLLLLARGADVNARDGSGMTPLHRAAACGRERAVQILLSVDGVDANARPDGDGRTALHRAVAWRQPKCFQALLRSGKVNASLTDADGRTASDLVSCARHQDPVLDRIRPGACQT
ncbi:Ankyrin repeat domain-containing protein [Plasmodiophora brassicae]|uniref:Uncharacterized protein n=1 Tax=Plasmodiophora brassicae TaxID=37360 RepID=A0A0G4J0L0_PLABS|nr:hypothetical protein PBRA_008440 [Plasmodiophora brassicae]